MAATQVTTIQGCIFQRARSANARSAIQKSPGVWMVDVHKGWKRAAISTPTTLAFTPFRDASNISVTAERAPERQYGCHGEQTWGKESDQSEQAIQEGIGGGTHRRAKVCGKCEKRAGKSLSGAISGEKGLLRYPPARHYRIFKQRQHHMSAAEDECSAAIESRKDRKPRRRKQVSGQRQDQPGAREKLRPQAKPAALDKRMPA